MTRFSRTFFALFMLALWLPATLHCGIERIGGFEGLLVCDADADADAGANDESHCDRDSCDVVEDGAYRLDTTELIVPAPGVAGLRQLLPDVVLHTPTKIAERVPPGRTARAEDWAVFWRYVERVTPPVRAPAGLA